MINSSGGRDVLFLSCCIPQTKLDGLAVYRQGLHIVLEH